MPDTELDIKSLFPEELIRVMDSIGQKAYRADQIFSWFSRGCGSWRSMTDIPERVRLEMQEKYPISSPELISESISAIDETAKYLWELSDGHSIETAVMKYRYGNTVCISSQVGCRQGCAFCASTIGGKIRDLTASEMMDEVISSEQRFGESVSHVVIMGIGEPLDNYEQVVRFLRLIHHPKGRNISYRNITLSTCGLIERFDDLARENIPITLSVSLHAPDDRTRDLIMPSNRGRGVQALIEKCAEYYQLTKRRVTFEYAMIQDVNDSLWQAELLAKRVSPLKAHVNLIPLNPVEERPFKPSLPEQMNRFKNVLDSYNSNYTVRRSLGGDVNAACGQLRRAFRKERA